MSEEQEGKKIKRSQPSAAPTEIDVGAAEGCDLLIFGFVTWQSSFAKTSLSSAKAIR
ncbi:hypothetical protein ACFQDJ_12335 [Pseudomonas brassicacearum]